MELVCCALCRCVIIDVRRAEAGQSTVLRKSALGARVLLEAFASRILEHYCTL